MSEFERYEIVSRLGGGGMGSVHLAIDRQLGRRVAIKRLREGFDTENARARFRREARAVAQLQHPNVVSIFDFGEHDGEPFIVMEYVRGETLRDLIAERRPLGLERKLEIIDAVCAGIACAHQAGIVHRDVKPSNIIVSTDGVVKILDFGLAKAAGTVLTASDGRMGSPNYMAPEQVLGQEVDHRVDVFAVAAVLYELLTYRQAFPGGAPEAIHHVLSDEPVPLRILCPGLSPVVERLINRGLDKNPARRFTTIESLRVEVARARKELVGEAPLPSLGGEATTRLATPAQEPSSPLSGRRVVLVRILGGLGLALAIGGLLWLGSRFSTRPAVPPETRGRTQPAVGVRTNEPAAPQGAQPGDSVAIVTHKAPRDSVAGTETAPPPSRLAARESRRVPAPAPISSDPTTRLSIEEARDATPATAAATRDVERAPGAAVPSPEQPPVQPLDDDREMILLLIGEFERAYASRDVAAVQRVQPFLTVEEVRALSREFLDCRSYSLQILDARIVVNGPRARVDCRLVREFVPVKGEPRRIESPAILMLERSNDAWVIAKVNVLR